MTQSPLTGIRGTFVDCVRDPFFEEETDCIRFYPDGLLILEEGKIKAFGDYEVLSSQYREIPTRRYRDRLILPGLIDTHIHYPQTEMIGSYGEQLLEWLNRYTFPTERKFADKRYAREIADFFLEELLRHGTTTAMVFAAVFPQSVEAFFEAAEARNLCMIAGKVMMDRNAPDYLCDTANTAYEDSKRLIQKWHGRGRLRYAVTPRFAPTSTPAQLQRAGQLLREFPTVYLQTHLSENRDEIAWVKELFPDCDSYLDTYDQAGLVTDRSMFAHGIYLSDCEYQRLSEAQSAIAFCPTSNLFLGSGLFQIEQAKSTSYPVKLGLGTDVGGGTSFSLLRTAHEAYKVAQLRQQKLSPFQSFFLATLGGAIALRLEHQLGNFEVGKEADFVVLNPQATPLMERRISSPTPKSLNELADLLFALMVLGEGSAVETTYIMGKKAYP